MAGAMQGSVCSDTNMKWNQEEQVLLAMIYLDLMVKVHTIHFLVMSDFY